MPQPITLAIAGDVMLGRLVNDVISQKGHAYLWGDVRSTISQADAFLINLECALTSHGLPWHDGQEKAFYFRANPEVVNTLRVSGVRFACVANNHICDFGMDGAMETIRVLDEAGISHAGAGANLAGAQAPALLTVKDTRLGVVAFADHPAAWAATPTSPGINYTPVPGAPRHLAAIRTVLATARQSADLVIFTIHWGPNMRARPSQEFKEFAHDVIDAGADLFWGHSAHLVQGVEVYRGKPILYDAGDFVDDYVVDGQERNDLSALFLLQIVAPNVEAIRLVPVQISAMQVNLAVGASRAWFEGRMTELCLEMGTGVRSTPDGLSILR